MPLKITKSLRVLIILLITIFLSNTVYAGSKMAAEQFSSTDSSIETNHQESTLMSSDEHEHHFHDDQPEVSDHCSKCTHCVACISAITSEVTQDMSLDLYQAIASTF